MHSYDKGFFLLDSLLAVFILSSICILCFSIYNLMEDYEKGYLLYQRQSNDFYEEILAGMNECEECMVCESD